VISGATRRVSRLEVREEGRLPAQLSARWSVSMLRSLSG